MRTASNTVVESSAVVQTWIVYSVPKLFTVTPQVPEAKVKHPGVAESPVVTPHGTEQEAPWQT